MPTAMQEVWHTFKSHTLFTQNQFSKHKYMQSLFLMSHILLYYQVQQRFDIAVEHYDFTVPALQVHKHKVYIHIQQMNNKLTFLFQAYEETYREEISLNFEFNNFVRNYELAYWGPNTALHQIGSPYETGMLSYQGGFIILNVVYILRLQWIWW